MIELKNIVVVIADTKNYGDCFYAIHQTLKHIQPLKVVWFTDIEFISDRDTVITYKISKIKDANDYSRFIVNKMPALLDNLNLEFSHVLVIQHDGYVLNANAWNPNFLKYDYIGAPWLYVDGRNVGNGGFSLRSKKLLELTKNLSVLGPEDECIGRLWRGSLEISGCVFAPEEIAHEFSFELHEPKHPTFGFHGCFHSLKQKRVLIKRMGAMGDVVQVEPVLRYWFKKGYKVYLLTSSDFMNLFYYQPYEVLPYKDGIEYDVEVDLDMAYENRPTMNHIEAYFDVFGEKDKASQPRLICDEPRVFNEPYVVMHIDKRKQAHRNPIHDFYADVEDLVNNGYTIVLIGEGEKLYDVTMPGVIPVINLSLPSLMALIWHSEFFIGIDSGPSHIAVAMGKKSIIHFGSVDPEIIHLDLENIDIKQGECEHKGCWHIKGGTEGQNCLLGLDKPKCCIS